MQPIHSFHSKDHLSINEILLTNKNYKVNRGKNYFTNDIIKKIGFDRYSLQFGKKFILTYKIFDKYIHYLPVNKIFDFLQSFKKIDFTYKNQRLRFTKKHIVLGDKYIHKNRALKLYIEYIGVNNFKLDRVIDFIRNYKLLNNLGGRTMIQLPLYERQELGFFGNVEYTYIQCSGAYKNKYYKHKKIFPFIRLHKN